MREDGRVARSGNDGDRRPRSTSVCPSPKVPHWRAQAAKAVHHRTARGTGDKDETVAALNAPRPTEVLVLLCVRFAFASRTERGKVNKGCGTRRVSGGGCRWRTPRVKDIF